MSWAVSNKRFTKVLLKSIKLQKPIPEHVRHIDRVHAKICIKQGSFERKWGLICETSDRANMMSGLDLALLGLLEFLSLVFIYFFLSIVFNYCFPTCSGPQIPSFPTIQIGKIHEWHNGL